MHTTRKLLALSLALVLLFSMASMTAQADAAICKIDNKTYDSLQEAVADAGSSTVTITLLETTEGPGVKVPSGSNITFELGGHTYTVTDPVGSSGTETNGFQLLKDSTITIQNGTIKAGSSAKIMLQNYANLTLKDVTLDARGSTNCQYVSSNNNGTVKITGSTSIYAAEGQAAFDVYYCPKNGYSRVDVTVNTTGTISGRIEYGGDGTKNDIYDKATLHLKNGTFDFDKIEIGTLGTGGRQNIVVSGGAYPNAESNALSSYLPKGVQLDKDGTVYDDKGNTAVARIGSVGYDSLQKAVNAAKSGETVTLVKGTTEDITVADSKSLKLNLNGHTITNKSEHTITVKIGAALTITGSGTVDNITHAKAAVWNEGTVTLNGGTYTRSEENGTSSTQSGDNSYYALVNHGTMTINDGVEVKQNGHFSSMIENGYYDYSSDNPSNGYAPNINAEHPTLTINGGTFKGGLNTVKNDDGGTLIINGGSFENMSQAAVQNHNIATINGGIFSVAVSGDAPTYAVDNCGCVSGLDQGLLTITGGTFTGADYAVWDRSSLSTAKVAISGGNFSGKIAAVQKSDGSKGNIAISGGTFNKPVDAYLVDGFEAEWNGKEFVIRKESSSTPEDNLPVILSPVWNQSITAAEHSATTLSVQAYGINSYQWYVDRNDGDGFVAISGATGASLTIWPSMEDNGNRYYCSVTNRYGSVHSKYFTLTVVRSALPPTTGDHANPALWVCLMALGASISLTVFAKRKQRNG